MKYAMLRIFVVLMLVCAFLRLVEPDLVHAADVISLKDLNVVYSQDFNSLSNSGTSASLPAGWRILESGIAANTLYTADWGLSNVADTYSYGSEGSSERALGGLQGSTLIPLFGAIFVNNTGGIINSLQITYTGEHWRTGKTNRRDRISFEYSTNATTLDNGTWISLPNGDLDYLTNATTSVGAKDGNNATYRKIVSYTITGLNIVPGSSFMIRWIDIDAVGDDDGMAVDDFFLTPIGVDQAPSVESIVPGDQATNVLLTSKIDVTFSEAVSVSASGVRLNCSVSGSHSVSISSVAERVTIDPLHPFAYDEECTLFIDHDAVSDADNSDPPDELIDDFQATFFTLVEPDDPPQIVSASPNHGEIGVALNRVLTVQFSEEVSVVPGWAEVTCSISGAHDLLHSGGPITWILSPITPFLYDEECILTLHADKVADADEQDPPDGLPADYAITFLTQRTPDAAPALLSSDPQNGSVNVAVDQQVSLQFSEPVNLADGWLTIKCSDSGEHGFSATGGLTDYLITPDYPFVYYETCALTVIAEYITDVDDNDPPDQLSADLTITFATQSPPDEAPTILSIFPYDGATDIGPGSLISVTFSEAVNLESGWFLINCDSSGVHEAQVIPHANVVTLDPVGDFEYGENCRVEIIARKVTDVDTQDPPDELIQGAQISFTLIQAPDLAPQVTATYPADGQSLVPLDSMVKVVLSEPVDLPDDGITLQCEKSGNHSGTSTGGPLEFFFDPDVDFEYGEVCSVLLKAEKVSDTDDQDPPDHLAADFRFTFHSIPDPASIVFPTVLFDGRTTPSDGAVIEDGIHRLLVQFNKEVLHDGSADAADRTENYRLLRPGQDGIYETDSCAAIIADDDPIEIDQIVYNTETDIAELQVNQGVDLPPGKYRLIVCGDHTIRDRFGNALNNGSSTLINFIVQAPTPPAIPGTGGTGGDSTSPTQNPVVEKTASPQRTLMIPVTGFPPGLVSTVPIAVTNNESLGDLWLEIPSMQLSIAITGIPKVDGNWDVSWLNQQAGWLEGSAYPTAEGNSVLTAHVWDALNRPGPFYGLDRLKYDDTVIVHSADTQYLYKVREVLSVKPENTAAMLKHQEIPWLTLVTCQGYDEEKGEYSRRILVRAVLVEIK